MASEPRHPVQPDPNRPVTDEHRDSRRWMIKTGAMLVPAIMTLRATPAWAQTDYTITAYRYGVGAGLCKNPKFNPNASEHSTAGQEFIPCPSGVGAVTDPDPIGSPDSLKRNDSPVEDLRNIDDRPRQF